LAAKQLQDKGYQAQSLVGGMKAWSLAWNSAEIRLTDSTFRVVQIRRTGKGCLSYLIASEGKAAIIDASLSPQIYKKLAQANGWQISHVLDTHIHADHLSRGRKLAELCGATYHLPEQDLAHFPYVPVQDNDSLDIGLSQLIAIRTPGHSLESTCYLVDDQALFTGDTLFLNAVGRPDLKAGPAQTRRRARMLYQSLQQLQSLPEETLVLPGHTSEPIAFDERPLTESMAQVREQVDLLSLTADEFETRLMSRIPATPPNHRLIVELNRAGQIPDGDLTELEAGANRCAAG